MTRENKKREKKFDGISNKFRFGRNMNEATMLATARAFITEAGPYAADFKNYGLSGTFTADLNFCSPPARGGVAAFRRRDGGSDAFEASFSNTAAATAEHAAATADTSAKIREGMIAGFGSPPSRGGVDAPTRTGWWERRRCPKQIQQRPRQTRRLAKRLAHRKSTEKEGTTNAVVG